MYISEKKMENYGGGQSCLRWKRPKFYIFNKQIFTRQFSWQNVIEISQIFTRL